MSGGTSQRDSYSSQIKRAGPFEPAHPLRHLDTLEEPICHCESMSPSSRKCNSAGFSVSSAA